MKRKILVDLDVLTNALWKGENEKAARKFLNTVMENVEILTPSTLIELIFNWKDRNIAKSILSFYLENSDILSQKTILREFERNKVDYKKIIDELVKVSGKEEDCFLVLVASVFGLDIITFNKKHLLNKKNEINDVLIRFNLKEVKINEPI